MPPTHVAVSYLVSIIALSVFLAIAESGPYDLKAPALFIFQMGLAVLIGLVPLVAALGGRLREPRAGGRAPGAPGPRPPG